MQQLSRGWYNDEVISVVQKAAQRGNKKAMSSIQTALQKYGSNINDDITDDVFHTLWLNWKKDGPSAIAVADKSLAGKLSSKLESFKNAISRM